MRRLDVVTYAWRNFLYTNEEIDLSEFEVTVGTIQDDIEGITEKILQKEPDMDFIDMCKLEIAEKREYLSELADKFVGFVKDRYYFNAEDEELKNAVLDSLCKEGTNSRFYEVACDWHEYAERADSAWKKISQVLSKKIDTFYCIQETLHSCIMEQLLDVQIHGNGSKNLQLTKETLEKVGIINNYRNLDLIGEEMLFEVQLGQGIGPVR